MGVLGDFLSGGQDRRAWLTAQEDKLGELLRYYGGPAVSEKAGNIGQIAEMLNPVESVGRSMTAGREMTSPGRTPMQRVGAAGDMLTGVAEVAAPLAGVRMAGTTADDMAKAVQDAFLSVSTTPKALAGRDFVANEAGGIRGWHGSPHDFNRMSSKHIGTGSGDAIDGRGLNFSDDAAEAVSYKRPDLRHNPFAPPEAQKFAGEGNLYEVDLNVSDSDIVSTRSKISELPQKVQDIAARRFRQGDEFAAERDLSFYLNSDPSIQDEIAAAGYKGFSADRYGNTNYVLFDDNLATILSKNGVDTPAGNIARLLREGDADKVTDDMLGALGPNDNADLWRLYESGATGQAMPMDEASRMARAAEMGFGNNSYHGTDTDIQAFDPRLFGRNDQGWYGRGVTTDTDPDVASGYANYREPEAGQNVLPVVSRGRYMQWPEGQDPFPNVDDARAGTRDIQGLGYDGTRMTNDRDLYGVMPDWGTEQVTFDPANIRSRFARFDPRLKHLSNLSASAAPIGIGALLGMQQDPTLQELGF